jgi:hypothetical protein
MSNKEYVLSDQTVPFKIKTCSIFIFSFVLFVIFVVKSKIESERHVFP